MADNYKSFNELVDRVEAKRKIYTAQDMAAAKDAAFKAGEASMRERAAGVADERYVQRKFQIDHDAAHECASLAQAIRALKGAT